MTVAERRKYSPSAGSEVKSEMHRYKRGTAKSGLGGRGGAFKSREQAIASVSRRLAKRERRSLPKINDRRRGANSPSRCGPMAPAASCRACRWAALACGTVIKS